MTKHFFKVLVIFVGMIVLGLIGVYLLNSFAVGQAPDMNNQTQFAR